MRIGLFALACLAMLGGASPARGASAASPDTSGHPHTNRAWSIGASVEMLRSDIDDRLLEAMRQFGWTDDTRDTVYFGLPVTGVAYPYADSPSTSTIRVWAERQLGPSFGLRAEFSIQTAHLVHGNRLDAQWLDITLDPYSNAILAMYGNRVRVGAGPTLDVTVVSASGLVIDESQTQVTPGLTLLASGEVYRRDRFAFGVKAAQHFGAKIDVGPYTDPGSGATYEAKGVSLTYTSIGLELIWSTSTK
jgi:hypothetical protein